MERGAPQAAQRESSPRSTMGARWAQWGHWEVKDEPVTVRPAYRRLGPSAKPQARPASGGPLSAESDSFCL